MSSINTIRLLRDWPVLRFYLEIPFVSIRTHLLTNAWESDTFEFVRVQIRIHKWSTEFNLYKNRIWGK